MKNAIEHSIAPSQPVRDFKTKFLQSMSKRFGENEENPLLAVATLVDPRFKRIHFTDVNANASAIRTASEMVLQNQRQQAGDSASQRMPQSEADAENTLWSYHDNLLATVPVASAQADVLNDVPVELQQFLSQPPCDRKDDPFKIWKTVKDVYPNIFPIAHKLSTPGSAIPCERLWSKAGRLADEDRNRLDPKKIGKLCFLQSVISNSKFSLK